MACIEEALREIRGKAALLAFMAECASETEPPVKRDTYLGLSDISDDIRELAESIAKALDVASLGREIRR